MSRIRLTDRPRPDLAKLAARDAGLSKFQGSKCIRGHDGIRYTLSGQCVLCVKMYNNSRNY